MSMCTAPLGGLVQQNWIIQAGVAFAASVVLSRAVIAFGVKDAPDEARKTQEFAVPTSGGLAVALSVLLATVIGVTLHLYGERTEFDVPFSFGWQTTDALIILAALSAPLLVGIADDRKLVSTKWKFMALAIICSMLGLMLAVFLDWFQSIDYIITGNQRPGTFAFVLGASGAALWLFVFVNASNFMDGSDGLALGCLAIMLAALIPMYIIQCSEYSHTRVPLVAFVFAILGFLVWNLQGKLYAGDAGSLLVGAAFGIASLEIVQLGEHSIFIPAILALPFLIDVLLTIIWRWRRKQNLLTAHLDHAYQLFRRSGWGHLQVAFLWWGLTAICAACAILADQTGGNAPFWTWLALLLIGSAAWVWQRRTYGPKVGAV